MYYLSPKKCTNRCPGYLNPGPFFFCNPHLLFFVYFCGLTWNREEMILYSGWFLPNSISFSLRKPCVCAEAASRLHAHHSTKPLYLYSSTFWSVGCSITFFWSQFFVWIFYGGPFFLQPHMSSRFCYFCGVTFWKVEITLYFPGIPSRLNLLLVTKTLCWSCKQAPYMHQWRIGVSFRNLCLTKASYGFQSRMHVSLDRNQHRFFLEPVFLLNLYFDISESNNIRVDYIER